MFETKYSVLGMRNFPFFMSYLWFRTAESLCPYSQWMTHMFSSMTATNIQAAVEDSQEGVAHQSVIICDKVLRVDRLLLNAIMTVHISQKTPYLT